MAGSDQQPARDPQAGSQRPLPASGSRLQPPTPLRKPLQVLHLSRKEQQPAPVLDEPNVQPSQAESPVRATNPLQPSAPVRSAPFRPGQGHSDQAHPAPDRTDPEDRDGDRFETASLEGLTMADLLGGEKPSSRGASPGPKPASTPARTVDEFDFDEDAFLAALDENEPVGATGEVVKGVVLTVESDGVYVDIGGKAPGFMPKAECGLGVIINLKERFPRGQPVEVLVTREQNADGMVTVSARALALRHSWDKVKQLEKDGMVVQVKVSGFNRGGVTCDLEGLRAFIPRSQLINGENHEELVGKTLGAAFLEVNIETHKLVLSEKRASTAARFQELEVGQLVEGQVVAVKPYGLFVDLGGVSGLLHQSCITGGTLRDLREVFDQGDRLKALITQLDPSRGRIGLNTALLEGQPGEWLVDKEKVMAEAEDRANRARNGLRQQEQTAG
ncbi:MULTISPECIES: S1 RNA-binding domain-containing protein [unclassified Synechococcus]|uniref:S1 RNA-binding domain-containing protein n=1 Tax=unclassified Synechococcus TaxID=2626047 RepID=UPI0021A424D4|nr:MULTISPECIES: S1 RNA-binding domain-containing protein [unclassified Synechococcus]MCT0213038.1 S1 RNA-binding domain-containing protein [Synechococcus sp. CS-1326]MCT0232283.1 S1 RNA-binding domain-containing protein [Synechococcus sp. CS-1327]